ncbi:hypothetical protein EJ05DRAFT_499866 [Pseudovirgaria hyperparasitica]|uniref:Uncharacterized protein n=1 Tax=Pseudovirgaria hyperparasitica TaxID=470096 RepID=A0A6A6W8T4_9PEZI|nr:uncharacterized protein EJ05DRAFT_499866 [Pseudovirgaria hyperparasitica]KAF2758340.1 hypothetical protein EJ05DRAFT_499866 [Pseudovirgaria hyperparasitica]
MRGNANWGHGITGAGSIHASPQIQQAIDNSTRFESGNDPAADHHDERSIKAKADAFHLYASVTYHTSFLVEKATEYLIIDVNRSIQESWEIGAGYHFSISSETKQARAPAAANVMREISPLPPGSLASASRICPQRKAARIERSCGIIVKDLFFCPVTFVFDIIDLI